MLVTVLLLLSPIFVDDGCRPQGPRARKMERLIDRARARHGSNPLQHDSDLLTVARRWTGKMKRSNRLAHNPNLPNEVTRWRILGENVGHGGTVRSLHRAFMRSGSHRDVILDPRFRYIGVAFRQTDGRLWVTADFEAYKNPGTTLKGC